MTCIQTIEAAEATVEASLILVVEDEFIVRCVTADALREAGYRVIEADCGDEARDMIVDGVPVDLVFSDVRMPGLVDGLGLLSWLRANHPAVDVILCSGHLSSAEAVSSGARAFVSKPYRTDDITQRIGECLRG